MQHDLIDNVTLRFKKEGAKVNASPILEGGRLIISCLASALAWSDPVPTVPREDLMMITVGENIRVTKRKPVPDR